jgi:hypothetical protein
MIQTTQDFFTSTKCCGAGNISFSSQKLLKIWVWDPGSEIQDPEKNLFWIQGVKKTADPGSAKLVHKSFLQKTPRCGVQRRQ